MSPIFSSKESTKTLFVISICFTNNLNGTRNDITFIYSSYRSSVGIQFFQNKYTEKSGNTIEIKFYRSTNHRGYYPMTSKSKRLIYNSFLSLEEYSIETRTIIGSIEWYSRANKSAIPLNSYQNW